MLHGLFPPLQSKVASSISFFVPHLIPRNLGFSPGAEQVEGMPFRNLNDGVTPVVIGGNDWASAWAVTSTGQSMLPVGRGCGGERQRELAYRFGVNLVMHVLTGNYKSDQVHVPALLDRLGQ